MTDFKIKNPCISINLTFDLKIGEKVLTVNCVQPISLGLIRSDIMLESQCSGNTCCTTVGPYCCWKQVEVNTIASGFGWLGPASASIHRSALLCSRSISYSIKI